MKEEIQKKYLELQILNKQIKNVQEQFISLQQQLNELNNLEVSLTELKDVKNNKEIFSVLGSGVFVKSKLIDNENVLVNVGDGVLVKKKLNEALDLVKLQANNISGSIVIIKEELNKAILFNESLTNEINEMVKKENKNK